MSSLGKRLPRDFVNNLGKYLGILGLFLFAIAMGSGYLSAAHSIQVIQDGLHERAHVEDFHFATQFEAAPSSIEALEGLGCTVFEDFTADVPLSIGGGGRLMNCRLLNQESRREVNQGYYFEGSAPKTEDEIALDRVFCDNNHLEVGDAVRVNDCDMVMVGIMSVSDYECLMEKNTDMIFNSTTFTVAQVTPEGFRRAAGSKKDYRYDVVLDDRSMDVADRTSFEENAADVLTERGEVLTDLVDVDSNMAIFFATDDVAGDQVMWQVLVGLLVIIMGFVFVVLANATIEQESAVIGTLLASGYRKGEIIGHYMVLPTLIGIVGCIAGNVLGLTYLSGPMQRLYYGSYSLPPYEYTFSPDVFVFTTIVPFALLEIVTVQAVQRRVCARTARKKAAYRLPLKDQTFLFSTFFQL